MQTKIIIKQTEIIVKIIIIPVKKLLILLLYKIIKRATK